MADLGLDVLAIPYVVVGRIVLLDPTFELHGFRPWGLAPALLFCATVAFFLGVSIERCCRWLWKRR